MNQQQPAAYFMNGKLYDWNNGQELPRDWTGIATAEPDRNSTWFRIGRSNGERSFTVVQLARK